MYEHDEKKKGETAVFNPPVFKNISSRDNLTTSEHRSTIQRKRNGLPDRLKAGIEALSGLTMDNVQVHYNSPKPAGLQALAYTQGNQIHVGPGQEKHLPHEAWHIVQQKLGRVKPTIRVGTIPVNDAPHLEAEADQMGRKAKYFQLPSRLKTPNSQIKQNELTTQRNAAINVSDAKSMGNGRYKIEANSNGDKAGSVIMHNKGKSSIELTDLGVIKTHRKQGIGYGLIKKAVQAGRIMGKTKISLAAQDNGSGRLTTWYKNLGFSQVNTNRLGYPILETSINRSLSQPLQRKQHSIQTVQRMEELTDAERMAKRRARFAPELDVMEEERRAERRLREDAMHEIRRHRNYIDRIGLGGRRPRDGREGTGVYKHTNADDGQIQRRVSHNASSDNLLHVQRIDGGYRMTFSLDEYGTDIVDERRGTMIVDVTRGGIQAFHFGPGG